MSITRQYRQYCTDVEAWHAFQTVDNELAAEVEPCPDCSGTDTQAGSITMLCQHEDETVYSTEKLGLVVAWVSNSTIDVDATRLGVEGRLVEPVNVTIDITASGANGLDTGSEASSTGYFVWILAKSTDGTHCGVLSLSATSPTMPAGYDLKRRVGWIYNNGSGHIYRFYHCADGWWWWDENMSAADFQKVNNGTATSLTDVPAFLIPSTADQVSMMVGVNNPTTWNGVILVPKGGNWENGYSSCAVYGYVSGGSCWQDGIVRPLGTNQQLQYRLYSAGGARARIIQRAWHDPGT